MKQPDNSENFVPRGAIAFFAFLIALGLIIWFGIYFLMLDRV
ncbi:cytochrome c oxidase subunit 2A [Chitinophaga sp. CB10]|nr:cytochrome c oxidase subunit 2A [Chitinophaga sp. CB10]